jgi:stage II sporulation protein AA (anti-sigma F factor antagonist)
MEVLTAKYDFNDDTLKITLMGEIDHHTAKAARIEIDEQIYAHRAKNVVIDLENVGFMDSSGLGLILGRYTHVNVTGGILKVLNPCKSAERVLRLAGAERIIPIIKTAENGK